MMKLKLKLKKEQTPWKRSFDTMIEKLKYKKTLRVKETCIALITLLREFCSYKNRGEKELSMKGGVCYNRLNKLTT